MRFHRDASGAWSVDPRELAERLGITAGHLQSQMLRGMVTSRVEFGSGDDEGRSRVTVCSGAVGWEGIFDASGRLVSERSLPPKR